MSAIVSLRQPSSSPSRVQTWSTTLLPSRVIALPVAEVLEKRSGGQQSLLPGRLHLERAALAQPPQPALVLLVERGKARPVVARGEKPEERNREPVVGLNREDDHIEEIRPDRDLDVRHPAALRPLLLVLEIHLAAF